MNTFIFKSYKYNPDTSSADFYYEFEGGQSFHESIQLGRASGYNKDAFEKALFLSFVLIGTSYYKTFPTINVRLDQVIDAWQAQFFTTIYQEGLSQFAYENGLGRQDLAEFNPTTDNNINPVSYDGSGSLALQSGGKDSLLTAVLLQEKNVVFTPWYFSSGSGEHVPKLLNGLGNDLRKSVRVIDIEGLKNAIGDGGKNGHVPITYIIQSIALLEAILMNKREIIVSIAHEGEEPHSRVGNLPITHQWSKTWKAELAFADYVHRYISSSIQVGSPLRQYSELHVAELFVKKAWKKYGQFFSSCNVANYGQGQDNTNLKWCGNCPKCANSYLLFAPFLPSSELQGIFNGQDLFTKVTLNNTFKGLLGIDGVSKPFECIGEIDELRLAYHMAQNSGHGYGVLAFDVPDSTFDYLRLYPAQNWATRMLQ